MKIGLLSLPLTWNYGGILQQYALKCILNNFGHNVLIISRRKNRKNPIVKFIVWFKWNFLRLVSNIPFFNLLPLVAAESFKKKYLYVSMSKNIYSEKEMYAVSHNEKLDAFVVGSDQVWNYTAAPQIQNYYFDFAQDMKDVKRIAYSASFAREEWIYPDVITQKCKNLVALFDAVSVREKDAVDLCARYFNKKAEHLCDPAFLLNKEDYLALVKDQSTKFFDSIKSDILFCYILDITDEKRKYVEAIAAQLGLIPFYFHETSKMEMLKRHFAGFDPTVESWLQCFDIAKYVVTDSFHGTVFSLIFNKPFISIANKSRGLSRFTSLLNSYCLADRLVFDLSEVQFQQISKEIDWVSVDAIISKEQVISFNYLQTHLAY